MKKELGRDVDDKNIEDRKLAKEHLSSHPIFKTWEAMNYDAQGKMWDCVTEIMDHEMPRLRSATDELAKRKTKRASLKLDPNLEIPRNITGAAIHRQPGGFAIDEGPDDITAGAYMLGGSLMYGLGRGAKTNYGSSDFVIGEMRKRFPDFEPTRILDVGCGTGVQTCNYAQAFPDAKVTGIECAPGLIRFAYARAESLDLPVDFIQMNAEDMSFEDESFDLIVSHIVGHETSWTGLPKMIGECWRLIKPGGVILHMDVPIQTGYLKLPEQVLNDWQVIYNGESFWMGWADADVRQIMLDQGYPEEAIITEHVPRGHGPGDWFLHGARKPA